MCQESDGCFRFGRFTVTWDAKYMDWAMYDDDEFICSFKTLDEAKKRTGR